MSALFIAGGFRDPRLVAALFGRPVEQHPARLSGWAVADAADGWYPRLMPQPGAMLEGAVVRLDGREDTGRVGFFCEVFGFDPVAVTLDAPCDGVEPRIAQALVPSARDEPAVRPPPGSGPELAAAALAEAMEARAEGAARAVRYWPQFLQYQSSRLRAAADGLPAGIRTGSGAVEALARRTPYRAFFSVEETDLRFPLFDGGLSVPVTRAAFCMADAVTVLPYDPRRDRVMVVEQFRFGPFVRGDRRPWSVEPIAGRIDSGESPEDAARREAREEAGLRLDRLLAVGRYYPSPGAVTEYVYSYLAPCDLPDECAGIGGLASEAENIRAILVGFDRLMALLADGLLENGPLLVSALQLARLRPELRAAG